MNKRPQPDLKKFILDWNNKFPWDRIWRKKYNIPFGSPEHKQTNFLDMIIDLIEDGTCKEEYGELLEMQKEDTFDKIDLSTFRTSEDNEMAREMSDFVLKPTQKEIDEDFDNLDLSSFNDPE